MGIRAAYILSRLEPEMLCKSLGLEPARETKYVPASDWVGRLKSGWTAIKIADGDFPDRVEGRIKAVSRQGDVMVAIVNETVMYLATTLYAKGAAQWRLAAGDEKQSELLTVFGRENMPEAVLNQLAALTPEDDVFAAPTDAMGIVTGVRYDDWLGPEDFDRLFQIKVPPPRMRDHGLGAVINGFIMRYPFTFLLVAFALSMMVIGPFAVLVGSALGALLEPLLGDWAHTCLFNCETTDQP